MKNSPGGQAELQKLQAAWRKAEREGELRIPCGTLSDARRLRFTLYNAVKAVKEGRVSDPKLLAVVESVSISIQETPPMVVMQHRGKSSMMQSLSAALGNEVLEEVTEAPVMTEEEVASLNRLQEMMQEAPEDSRPKNPYFTRERR